MQSALLRHFSYCATDLNRASMKSFERYFSTARQSHPGTVLRRSTVHMSTPLDTAAYTAVHSKRRLMHNLSCSFYWRHRCRAICHAAPLLPKSLPQQWHAKLSCPALSRHMTASAQTTPQRNAASWLNIITKINKAQALQIDFRRAPASIPPALGHVVQAVNRLSGVRW